MAGGDWRRHRPDPVNLVAHVDSWRLGSCLELPTDFQLSPPRSQVGSRALVLDLWTQRTLALGERWDFGGVSGGGADSEANDLFRCLILPPPALRC